MSSYRASHSDKRLFRSSDAGRFNRDGKGTDNVTAELDGDADSLKKKKRKFTDNVDLVPPVSIGVMIVP